METMNLIAQLIATFGAIIPLILALIKYVKQAVQEKNWTKLVNLLMNLMAEAEDKFTTGADKKEWVISMVKASADAINYTVDDEQLSTMIDNFATLTKKVNI